MKIIAALAVVVLIIVAFVQGYGKISKNNRSLSAKNEWVSASNIARTPSGDIDWQTSLGEESSDTTLDAEDPDGLGNIADNVTGALLGSYMTLAESDSYTPEDGEKIAENIAASLKASVSYPTYSDDDLKTDNDTSYERMLAYRSDLRIALEPLLKNPGYELNIFANYIESRDQKYLEQLGQTAENYKLAIENAANVVVPRDAVSQHVGILNSLSEFGAIVERLSRHADDAFASAALLRTYNESEANLVMAFNKLAAYYRDKKT